MIPQPASTPVVEVNFGFILAIVSLILGVASLFLGGFSIWLAWHFKKEADEVNKRTTDLLIEVKTDAKTIANVTAGELKSWGDTSRQLVMNGTVSGRLDLGGGGEQAAPAPATPVVRPQEGVPDGSVSQ